MTSYRLSLGKMKVSTGMVVNNQKDRGCLFLWERNHARISRNAISKEPKRQEINRHQLLTTNTTIPYSRSLSVEGSLLMQSKTMSRVNNKQKAMIKTKSIDNCSQEEAMILSKSIDHPVTRIAPSSWKGFKRQPEVKKLSLITVARVSAAKVICNQAGVNISSAIDYIRIDTHFSNLYPRTVISKAYWTKWVDRGVTHPILNRTHRSQ